MNSAWTRHAVDPEVGVQDDEHRERRQHEHDVGEHVEHLVDEPAAVAGDEADRHADDRREPAAEQPDQEGRPQPVGERTKTSCPNVVVPNQYSPDGGAAGGPTYSLGPWSVNSGAMSPSSEEGEDHQASPPTTFRLRRAK